MIANGTRVRSMLTQDCRPGAFSVVPFDKLRAGSSKLDLVRRTVSKTARWATNPLLLFFFRHGGEDGDWGCVPLYGEEKF